MKRVIEVRKIGDMSARLVREAGVEYVELFVRLAAARPERKRLVLPRRRKSKPRKKVKARKKNGL